MMKIDKIPVNVNLAFSGGVDSVFAMHYLKQGRKNFKCLYFNHGTKFGDVSEKFAKKICQEFGVPLIIERINKKVPKNTSKEKFWHDERYEFFDRYNDVPIVTAHHLDDQIETMLMGFCKGKIQKINSKIVRKGDIIRPFLNVKREQIEEYCLKHNLEYMHDPSNDDHAHPRNRIRHNVIPELLKAYPGLYKTLS